MSTGAVILICFAIFVGLPVLSYMMVKFGAAGYFRARRRDKNQSNNNDET